MSYKAKGHPSPSNKTRSTHTSSVFATDIDSSKSNDLYPEMGGLVLVRATKHGSMRQPNLAARTTLIYLKL
jgi:hypothetical protein